jgi:shikimate O-hydroxycinnamoyltransferase
MANIEVHIISKELIKPSSPTIQQKKPYKLSLFDQLTPTTYSPAIFFYPMNDVNFNNITAKTRVDSLKKSLSETLNLYYPFSGRVKDNLFIDCFSEGVPFLEAQVNCRLSDYLKHNEVESLNLFLPCQPFTKENMSAPISAFQVSIFACGGISLGWSASHKLVDGGTAKAFLSAWASKSRGEHTEAIQPDFSKASLFFPPRNPLPRNHISLMETLWFTEGNYITRRFVFDPKAIAMLRAKAKAGKPDTKPSRTETLSCFIWKCCMAASKAISDSPKPSIMVEAVNLRSRTKPPMSEASIGNIFWWATAVANPTDTNTELHELVNQLNEAIALYDSDYTRTMQGEEGFETMSDYCSQLEGLFSLEKPDIFAFTCWCYLGLTKANFGWGEPLWVGLMGKVGPAFRNLTVLVETKDGNGIEAWVTLDEERMAVLERDPEFLAFASPNPKFSSL